jgi:hypothetical protein
VGVHERADRAQLRDRAQRGEEERAVRREDRDGHARTDAGAAEHPREAVHLRVVGAVRDRIGLEFERDAVGDRLGLRADERTEGVGRPLELRDDGGEIHGAPGVAGARTGAQARRTW